MIYLKKSGVSGPVIAELLKLPTGAVVSSLDSPDPAVNHPPGVYMLSADGTHVQRIDPVVSNQAKTGGIFGYALTGGLASMSVKATIQNETARVHGAGLRPIFYFFFDESQPDAGRNTTTWASGAAATTTSPSEFTLIHLEKKSGRREVRVGSRNIAGAKTGVMDKDRLAFDYQMVRPGVYKVLPQVDLPAGEYGFIVSLTGAGAGGALTARVFDFSL